MSFHYSPLNKSGYTPLFKNVGAGILFFLEDIITFIQQGSIKLIKSDIKDTFFNIQIFIK